jgi:membrane-associated phospholipid phosphatase
MSHRRTPGKLTLAVRFLHSAIAEVQVIPTLEAVNPRRRAFARMPHPTFPSHPFGLATLRRDFWFKSVFGVACIVVFSGIFQWLQQHPRAEPQMWEACPSWEVIPFHAAWTWPYLALFPLIAVTWMAQPGWREVCRFFGAMLATGLVAWTFFYVWPTGSVRLSIAEIPWYYRAVITADAPLNSFPCLHAAFSVVAAFALLHGALRISRSLQVILWVLVAAICVAAVALRQHTDFDVLGGLVLGGGAGWAYRRSFARDGNQSETESDLGAVVEAELPTRD